MLKFLPHYINSTYSSKHLVSGTDVKEPLLVRSSSGRLNLNLLSDSTYLLYHITESPIVNGPLPVGALPTLKVLLPLASDFEIIVKKFCEEEGTEESASAGWVVKLPFSTNSQRISFATSIDRVLKMFITFAQ